MLLDFDLELSCDNTETNIILIFHSDAEQIAKKRKKALPKSFDGKFFIVQTQNEETGNLEARCTTCNESKKGNIASTGNFLGHYKKKHPSEAENLNKYIKSGKMESNNLRQPILQEILHTVTDAKVC